MLDMVTAVGLIAVGLFAGWTLAFAAFVWALRKLNMENWW